MSTCVTLSGVNEAYSNRFKKTNVQGRIQRGGGLGFSFGKGGQSGPESAENIHLLIYCCRVWRHYQGVKCQQGGGEMYV